MLISVSYSEIMMKGGNRGSFERLLTKNILAMLCGIGTFTTTNIGGRILLSCAEPADMESARTALLHTFGIDSLSFPIQAKASIDDIMKSVLENSSDLPGKKIRVEAKRSDKSFPVKSQQINQMVGKALVDRGCRVDLENPDKTIFIDILPGKALIYCERIRCLGACLLVPAEKRSLCFPEA